MGGKALKNAENADITNVESVSKKADEQTVSRKKALIKFGALTVFTGVIVIIATVAWFTMNKDVETGGMSVTAVKDNYTIRSVEGSVAGIYDDSDNESDYVRDVLLEKASKSADTITWQITEDTLSGDTLTKGKNIGNGPAEGRTGGIVPGSSGELQFVVDPEEDVDIKFTFYMYGYTGGINEQGVEDKSTLSLIGTGTSTGSRKARELLNGHILLFESCDDGKFSGLIASNDDFERVLEKSFTAQETVSIYWVWPETLAELILDDADPDHTDNLRGRSSLCSSDGRIEVIKLFNSHTDWFLYDPNSSDPNWQATFSGTTQQDIAATADTVNSNYALYSSFYNEADQCIGTNVTYIMLDMTAD